MATMLMEQRLQWPHMKNTDFTKVVKTVTKQATKNKYNKQQWQEGGESDFIVAISY